MKPFVPAAAVLVELQLGQRHLRLAGQAWHHPGVWIRLLQLIHAAVAEVLERLPTRRIALDVPGERSGLGTVDQVEEAGGDVAF